MSRQAYTHLPVQGASADTQLLFDASARTMSSAVCPPACAGVGAVSRVCPCYPTRSILGGGHKLGSLPMCEPMPLLDTRVVGCEPPPTHAGAQGAQSGTPPTAYPAPCSTHTALSCNRGLSPGVPAVCGFCDLSNPCRCRARIVAKFGCLSATHPPARCVRGCRSGGAYAWAACRGFVCISPAAPGWGIPMGVFQ